MRALVVGAGAIGGPVVLALASASEEAGFSSIRVCDDDVVEASNLQRQIQFTLADVGEPKAVKLAELAVGRGAAIEARTERFEASTAEALLEGVSLVIDGTDNFESKFLVNDRARDAGVPALIASALGDQGQLFVSIPSRACYRCLFETPPTENTGTCAQVGVLAPVPGVVAGHAVAAAVQIARGTEPEAVLTIFPGPSRPARSIDFQPRSECPACSEGTSRIAS